MMNKAPTIYTLDQLINQTGKSATFAERVSGWVPARPLGFFSIGNRLEAAWLAFTGKADVVIWPDGQ